ncbi:MAG: hypothetical protein HPY60_10810 [Candidatus Methanofastidiosum sp.]|nr:hypothetical protein [Methanofastidiosum sp.]
MEKISMSKTSSIGLTVFLIFVLIGAVYGNPNYIYPHDIRITIKSHRWG